MEVDNCMLSNDIRTMKEKSWDVFIISIANFEIFSDNFNIINNSLNGSKQMFLGFNLHWFHDVSPSIFVQIHDLNLGSFKWMLLLL